ncbi:N-acetyltransferase family protein [Roseovarius sp. CAU 1744]|uniref:GNAT family N-acetyltransferase n=1 Tax=Roseovarius sp. CAU 1744 TaxID=3140368 RepID=UPI00325A7DEE
MIIRAAASGDAGAICAYWNPQIRDTAITFTTVEKDATGLARTIETCLSEGRAYLVAADEDDILGHATYAPFRSGPGYAFTAENTVIVAPDAWGTGVSQALMTALEEHARTAGIHSMIAGISSENPRAVAFHEKIGYRLVATVPEAGRKFGRWMDLVLMQKLL